MLVMLNYLTVKLLYSYMNALPSKPPIFVYLTQATVTKVNMVLVGRSCTRRWKLDFQSYSLSSSEHVWTSMLQIDQPLIPSFSVVGSWIGTETKSLNGQRRQNVTAKAWSNTTDTRSPD